MRIGEHHKTLVDGVGKCSVPMWRDGVPAGFCDQPAYGGRPPGVEYIGNQGEVVRTDGKYAGFVPALACPTHGRQDHLL